MKKQNVERFISADLEKIKELINNYAEVWEYTIDDIALTSYRINDKEFYECLVTFSTKKNVFKEIFDDGLIGYSLIEYSIVFYYCVLLFQ